MEAADLRSVGLFAGLSDEQLDRCARRCQEVEVHGGTHLTRQDDYGYKFFAILDGNVEVRREGKIIAELGPGDVFGEMALHDSGRRNAEVIAATRLRVAQMMIWDFRQMLEDIPDVAERLELLVQERSSEHET